MTVPPECLRVGLDYLSGHVDHSGVSGHVDHSGDVYVVDVGRDVVHSEPLLVASWYETTSGEAGSFVGAIFDPEHLAKSYTPDENVRVAYDHDAEPQSERPLGEGKSVTVHDTGEEYRERYREESKDFYTPARDSIRTLPRLFD